MDICIIAQYSGNFQGESPRRFEFIANCLAPNHEVEIITSDFNHTAKKNYTPRQELYPFKVTAIHDDGYPKNVCVQRLHSDFKLGKSVLAYLNSRKKPDCVYCAVPSLSVADAAARYCRKNGVRYIVDIQDLWPEAFQMVFHAPVLSDMLFYPMKKIADRVYAQADEIVAVSQTYCDRAMKVNHKVKSPHSVFLGTKMSDFDSYKEAELPALQKNPEEIWLGYCGTLGHSYDLNCVLDALALLQQKGEPCPRFIVMGDGPKKAEFEAYAKEKHVDTVFTGRLPYPKMCATLCQCDIAVNPITHGAAQSIINKHGDYAMAGIPVVSTQECPEYRHLVNEYQMGFNCANNDAQDLAQKLSRLMHDPQLRASMGASARRCAEERFDRQHSYAEIINVILN